MSVDTAIGPAPCVNVPSIKRRMACFVYEGMMLFGIGLIYIGGGASQICRL